MNRTPHDDHVRAYLVATDPQWLARFRHDAKALHLRYETDRAGYRLANPIVGAAEHKTFV